jgi:hypothetical protein
MISIQALNDALVAVVFMIGAALALTAVMVTAAALWERHLRRAGVRAVEQYVAAAAYRAAGRQP